MLYALSKSVGFVQQRKEKKMGKAILAFVLSSIVGIAVAFFNPAMGIIFAMNIMGAFIVYEHEHK